MKHWQENKTRKGHSCVLHDCDNEQIKFLEYHQWKHTKECQQIDAIRTTIESFMSTENI